MEPLTVLHLAANRWWTGSADPTLRLVSGLRDRGHRVLLGVVLGDRFEVKVREHGIVPVAGLDLRPRLAPGALLHDARRLRAVVRAEGVQIVHAHHSHDHWLALVAAGAWAGSPRIPVVRTFHSFRAVRRDRLSRWLYRRTATAVAVSRQIEVRCREIGWPPSRLVWIPGAADLDRFASCPDPSPIREEFRLGGDPVVVTVSRLAPRRGHELLLEGFRLLRARCPRARLLVVGKGENREHLERMVRDLGLGPAVAFTGYRDRDLPAVLAAAHCFALMGAGSDDSCRAVLEAMAAGRPVVARRVGALPETVVHGETGLLVDDDRPAAVAEALARVLDDPEGARRMGAAGRCRAETEFSAARSVEIVERAYAALR